MHFRCLIPLFDGAILSQEWKDVLWDKFVTQAPRSSQRGAIGSSPLARARCQSSNTTIAGFARDAGPGDRHQSRDGGEVALTCHGIFPPPGIRVRPHEGTDNEANEIQ